MQNLDRSLYKRIFLYDVFNTRNRTGIVATFILDNGRVRVKMIVNLPIMIFQTPKKQIKAPINLQSDQDLYF